MTALTKQEFITSIKFHSVIELHNSNALIAKFKTKRYSDNRYCVLVWFTGVWRKAGILIYNKGRFLYKNKESDFTASAPIINDFRVAINQLMQDIPGDFKFVIERRA